MQDTDVKQQLEAELEKAADVNEVENIRVAYLGKKGYITELLKNLKDLKGEQKKEFGQKINILKAEADAKITERIELLKKQRIERMIEKSEQYDVTLPCTLEQGSYHPLFHSSRTRTRCPVWRVAEIEYPFVVSHFLPLLASCFPFYIPCLYSIFSTAHFNYMELMFFFLDAFEKASKPENFKTLCGFAHLSVESMTKRCALTLRFYLSFLRQDAIIQHVSLKKKSK